MADSADNVLELLIKLGYVGAENAEAARDAIAGIKKETGDLSTSLPEGSALWLKYKNVLQEADGATLSHRESLRLMHIGLRQMGAAFPEMGALTHLLFNPLTAGFAAAAVGMEAYFKWQERIEEKYNSMLTLAQKVNDDIREITSSGRSADEMFIEMQKAMAKAHEEGHGLSADMERDKEFAKAARDAYDASAERVSQLHKDTANLSSMLVDLLAAAGQIQPGRADQMKLEIAHAQKLQELDDQRAKAVGDVKQKQSELSHAQELFNAAGGQFPERVFQSKQGADERVTRLEATIKNYEKIKADLKVAEEEAEAQSKKGITIDSKSLMLLDDLKKQEAMMKAAYDKAKQELPGAEQAKVRDDKAYDDLQKAKDAIKSLSVELAGLQQKLSEVTASTVAAKNAENKAFATESTTDRLKGGTNVDEIFNAGVIAQKVLQQFADKGMSPEQVIAAGEKARLKAGQGKTLTDQDQKAIANEDLLRKAQDQLKASSNLLTAMGYNADQILANFARMVAMHQTNTQLHKATQDALAVIHQHMRDMQTTIERSGR